MVSGSDLSESLLADVGETLVISQKVGGDKPLPYKNAFWAAYKTWRY
jgi:hypothetical protein